MIKASEFGFDGIEVTGNSLSLKIWKGLVENISSFVKEKIYGKNSDLFSLESECPGFHDIDSDHRVVRGSFSAVTPFEVSRLVDGIMTKELLKRVDTVEFFLLKDGMVTWGCQRLAKNVASLFSVLTGYGFSLRTYEFDELSMLQNRFQVLKRISVLNGNKSQIRRLTMAGAIENYTEVNGIDPKNHHIRSVSGLLDTPTGPMTVTVDDAGGIRLGTRRGYIISLDVIQWILTQLSDRAD